MRNSTILSCVLLLVFGCGSPGKPLEQTNDIRYKNSLDFIWSESLVVLKQQYRDISSVDRVKRSITTAWDVQASPFSNQGYRSRLTVTFDGDVSSGFLVKAIEEEEINREEQDPLVLSEADWEPTTPSGARAQKFLWLLHRRLNPSQKWRDNADG